MMAIKSRLRQIVHVVRRKNSRVLRICMVVLLTTLIFIGLHQGSDYIEIDLLSNITYLNDYKAETNGTVSFDASKLRNVLKLTMDEIRRLSPQDEIDRTRGKDCRIGDIQIENSHDLDIVSRAELLKCVELHTSTKDKLKDLHRAFLHTMKDKIIPRFHKEMYVGSGIVFVAGGKFTMHVMPAIKAIRANAGGEIPIEIMIPPENTGESSFCDNVLPLLDPSGLTRCVFMETLFDSTTLGSVKGYQLKALALLASSFRKTLLLDADNYVVNPINKMFNCPIFDEFGLALWPDYWRRLHHPGVYDIAGIEVDTTKRTRYSVDNVSPAERYKVNDIGKVPFHDLDGAIPDGSTESGQLLVDKHKHLDTIILSLYYNYNGPSYYYPLLGQGFAGEGDKDTFAFAAKALSANGIHRNYYQVKAPVRAMGYWANKKDEVKILSEDRISADEQAFRGVAMIQHDLNADFEAYKKARQELHSKPMEELRALREEAFLSEVSADFTDIDKVFWQEQRKKGYDVKGFLSFFKEVPVSFIHSHLPKYDPWEYAANEDMMFDGRKTASRHEDEPNFTPAHHGHFRMYNDEFPKLTNYDLELSNWLCFQKYVCQENGYKNFNYLLQKVEKVQGGHKSLEHMCDYINKRVEMLLATTWEGSKVM
ncbi:hypothetical protein HG536_0B04210 [Torulaspora globosa]|uniref:Alpha-1,2-mannosyltransferase n=1 Tax=Torulaspora globosa TaxID=48254 RepID=A0A7G3ZDH1_9SACH|nr:uncharacterized protein HG536_0B04210 [Torulaspora globosa]QLL31557.1 hypothetical protein HG536_0B04210 [Torulaspora globosa]